LPGAQGLDLGQGEVFGEVGGGAHAIDHWWFCGSTPNLQGHIGGVVEHGLVAGDHHAVLGQHQVGFDVVRTLADRQVVAGQRVLGPVARRAAVADDDRRTPSSVL
jgi:hypothetical protein